MIIIPGIPKNYGLLFWSYVGIPFLTSWERANPAAVDLSDGS